MSILVYSTDSVQSIVEDTYFVNSQITVAFYRSPSGPQRDYIQFRISNPSETEERQTMRPISQKASNRIDKYGKSINRDEKFQT